MAENDTTCLVYVNSEGISKDVLNDIKTKIIKGQNNGASTEDLHFEESSLSYRDL